MLFKIATVRELNDFSMSFEMTTVREMDEFSMSFEMTTVHEIGEFSIRPSIINYNTQEKSNKIEQKKDTLYDLSTSLLISYILINVRSFPRFLIQKPRV